MSTRWKITYDGGAENYARGEVDIWTGKPGVISVEAMPEPPEPPEPVPIIPPSLAIYSWSQFNAFLIGLLDSTDVDVGRARLQTILEAARDKTGTTNADKNTRSFYLWFANTREFTKIETDKMLSYLQASSIITEGQRNAVLNAWEIV